MRKRLLISFIVVALAAPASILAQGLALDSVNSAGVYGDPMNFELLADNATEITFYFGITGHGEVAGGFTSGLRVYSTDDAQWNDATGVRAGPAWEALWDTPGGFFISEFSIDGAGADTIGFGAVAITEGLPASYDDDAFRLTIGPLAPADHGKTVVIDSSFFPPHGHWILAGSGGSFSWGGPYTFTLVDPSQVGVAGLDGGLPERFALAQNYPNPFNPDTEIRFDLPTRSQVRIAVFNVMGQQVRLLEDGERSAGSWVVTWDGRSDAGSEVSSGVYFCKMEAGAFSQSRKMMLVR